MTDTDHGNSHGAELALKANEHLIMGFTETLGLKFTDFAKDRLTAEFTVTPAHHQNAGIVHGGVYCAVIETMASVAAAYWYGREGTVVGVNNNTDFLRSIKEGTLYAEATPIHRGRSQQLWQVTITDIDDRLIAKGQVRLANLANKPPA